MFSPISHKLFKQYGSRTKIGWDLEVIRKEREFYLDYYEIVSLSNSKTEKQAVDEIMKKTCTKAFSFHDFCWIIQKFILITRQINWRYWKKTVCLFKCCKPCISISIGWKIMSIWIFKKRNEISKKRNFLLFLRIRMLIIFHYSEIGRREWWHLKE